MTDSSFPFINLHLWTHVAIFNRFFFWVFIDQKHHQFYYDAAMKLPGNVSALHLQKEGRERMKRPRVIGFCLRVFFRVYHLVTYHYSLSNSPIQTNITTPFIFNILSMKAFPLPFLMLLSIFVFVCP